MLRQAQGPLCSVLDGQLACDATAAETDKDVSSEEVDRRGSMFLLGSGSGRCDRRACRRQGWEVACARAVEGTPHPGTVE